MPTTIHADVIGEDAVTHEMMKRVVDAIGPIAACVDGDRYRLRPASDIPFEEVRTAVFMATGVFLREAVMVNQAAYDASRLQEGGFSRTLERDIEALHGFRVLTALGSVRWNRLRHHFGYDAVIPLTAHFAGARTRVARQNLRAALFHFWGSVFAHDDRRFEQLLPLIELLPRAIPLGEVAGRSGTWAVLVA